MMQSENLRQRAAVLGLQVFSKRSAIRLGIVTQIWLDVDQRRVMGVSVAERFVPGTPIGIGDTFYMSLEDFDLFGAFQEPAAQRSLSLITHNEDGC